MISELRDETGEIDDGSIIRRAISEFYAKTFPNYVRTKGKPFTPDEEIARENAKIASRRRTEEDRQRSLCEKLGGTVEAVGSGYVCKYKTFSLQGIYEQTLPLDHISEELIETQYHPDKETVLKYLKKRK